MSTQSNTLQEQYTKTYNNISDIYKANHGYESKKILDIFFIKLISNIPSSNKSISWNNNMRDVCNESYDYLKNLQINIDLSVIEYIYKTVYYGNCIGNGIDGGEHNFNLFTTIIKEFDINIIEIANIKDSKTGAYLMHTICRYKNNIGWYKYLIEDCKISTHMTDIDNNGLLPISYFCKFTQQKNCLPIFKYLVNHLITHYNETINDLSIKYKNTLITYIAQFVPDCIEWLKYLINECNADPSLRNYESGYNLIYYINNVSNKEYINYIIRLEPLIYSLTKQETEKLISYVESHIKIYKNIYGENYDQYIVEDFLPRIKRNSEIFKF